MAETPSLIDAAPGTFFGVPSLRDLDSLDAQRKIGARAVERGPNRTTRENPANLTRCEREVLELLAEGLANAEIAERLVVSGDHQVSAILRKLGAANRVRAVIEAMRLGITAARGGGGTTASPA